MWNFGRWFGYVYEGSYGTKKPPSEVGGERKEILHILHRTNGVAYSH